MASWIPGLGESKPQARKLFKSFFGYVPDDGSVDIFDKKAEKPAESPHQDADSISEVYAEETFEDAEDGDEPSAGGNGSA